MFNGVKIFLFLLVFIFGLVPVNSVHAVSVGVKPKEVNLNVLAGREGVMEVLIFNAGEDPALYKISPDAYEDKISIEPNDFRLEPNGNQIITVKVKTWIPEEFSTNISVVGRPLGAGGVPAITGVKVPINVIASALIIWQILGIVLGLCFLALVVLKLKKKALLKIKNN